MPVNPAPTTQPPVTRHGFRTDIQGLRAVAVVLVVVFHLFPQAVTGGYVGVDVFFVISGYLISGLLIRRAERDGRVDFRDFYIRRARRLLPAACLVLVATGLVALFILPRTLLPGLGREILASAFYIENFYLYAQGRDYLALDAAPGPLQHYWSLSIEEQFYIVWPLLIAGGAWLARRAGLPLRAVLFVALGLLAALSFAASVLLTPRDPGAYFVTTTRIWELALGGLLAIAGPWLKIGAAVRTVLRWAGLAMVLMAGFAFSEATVFPGHAAALPTLGTLLLLLPVGARFDPSLLLERRLATWLGDISYSLYLWHWPIIVLGGYLVARQGGDATAWAPWQYGAALAVMLALSHLSKVHIEDRFRHVGSAARPGRRALDLSAAFLGASVAMTAILMADGDMADGDAPPRIASQRMDPDYPGARALVEPDLAFSERPVLPPLDRAVNDYSALYRQGCQLKYASVVPNSCAFGDPDGTRTVVLIGDSHAAQWLPALESWADGRGIRIVTHTKSSCPFLKGPINRSGVLYPECEAWNDRMIEGLLADPPDLLVTAKISGTKTAERNTGMHNGNVIARALSRHWDRLTDAGVPVVALGHTPRFDRNIPDCLSAPGAIPSDCTVPRTEALRRGDHNAVAAERSPDVVFIDPNDWICEAEACPPIIGNVLVYRDMHHLTATYARTIAPYLGAELDRVLGADAP